MTDPPSTEIPLVPVRMVNEWVYCPRLAYLEWVDGEWADTGDTEDGRRTHARVDVASGRLPPPGEDQAEDTRPFQTRSVTMSSERLGIIAKMDVIEGQGRRVVPVDFKRGKRPHTEHGASRAGARPGLRPGADPPRMPVMRSPKARCGSREAVSVFGSNSTTTSGLGRSPRFPGCETRFSEGSARRHLRTRRSARGVPWPGSAFRTRSTSSRTKSLLRPLNPADDAALPLHVQTPGALVRKKGDRLHVTAGEEVNSVRLADVSEVNLYGPVSITTPTIAALLRRETPVSWHSTGGWFLGQARSPGRRALDTRRVQFRLADDPGACNRPESPRGSLQPRSETSGRCSAGTGRAKTDSAETSGPGALAPAGSCFTRPTERREPDRLLGREGEAGGPLLRPEFHEPDFIRVGISQGDFAWTAAVAPAANGSDQRTPVLRLFAGGQDVYGRASRPPDFDPLLGFFHRPRPGRPASVTRHDGTVPTDLCVIAPSSWPSTTVRFRGLDFVRNGPACAMKPSGRRALIAAWERRLDQEAVHPGLRLSDQHAPHHRRAVPPARAPPARRDPTCSRTTHRADPSCRKNASSSSPTTSADRRRWRRVLTIVEGYGDRLQLSVFQCRLTVPSARIEMATRLEEVIRKDQDSVMFLDLGPADKVTPRVESLGRPFEAIQRRARVL